MLGISAFGAYVPLYRMKRETISSAMSWFNPRASRSEERTVANYDEDSITMAVTAAIECLNGRNRNEVDGLYFATTVPPYKERQNSGIIATALDLCSNIKTADFTTSTKSGTGAILSAYDSVENESAKSMLVCVSDCRLSKVGSDEEQAYGDGATAFLINEENAVATLEGSKSVSYDFVDSWKIDTEKFGHVWEDRYIREMGYNRFISEAIAGLLDKYHLHPKEISKVCYPPTRGYVRNHEAIGKKLGFSRDQIQDHLFDKLGDIGNAHPLLIFALALEKANPGDKIIVSSYGYGSDALLFEVKDEIEKTRGEKRVLKYLDAKRYIGNFEKYLSYRDLMPVDVGIRKEEQAYSSMPVLYRNRREILGMVGSKCKKCGTPQYPRQRVCVNCEAIDEIEDYPFSDKKGKILSFTEDHVAATINPPVIHGIIDFEGGGRYWFEITDCDSGELEVGTLIKMAFRRKYADEKRGVYSYFWKAVPLLGAPGDEKNASVE